jgi:hypothetical protein
MRKRRRRIDGAILWAWLGMLALADWRSTAGAAALFAALVLWETVRTLKGSRQQAKTPGDERPVALSTSLMEPASHA